MISAFRQADDILRGTLDPLVPGGFRRGVASLVLFVIVCGTLYGAVMGTFGGFSQDRMLQIAYAAVKVPLLLLSSFGLGLPMFFVLNTLCGLRDDFRDAVRALVAAQAGLTIILSSLA